MAELCKDLCLSIFREDDPEEKDRELVRVVLSSPLEMLEVTVCQQINITTQQSRRYHIKEAVVIALRKVVSEAFRETLISDSLGEWKISRPTPSQSKPEVEVDLSDSML